MSPAEVAADIAQDLDHAVHVARLFRDGLVTQGEALWLLHDERSRWHVRGTDVGEVLAHLREVVGA